MAAPLLGAAGGGSRAQAGGHQWSSVCCRWQFASDGGDIGFGVFLKTKMGERQRAGEMTEVLPSQRYNAHMVPEDGSLACLKAGVCKNCRFYWSYCPLPDREKSWSSLASPAFLGAHYFYLSGNVIRTLSDLRSHGV